MSDQQAGSDAPSPSSISQEGHDTSSRPGRAFMDQAGEVLGFLNQRAGKNYPLRNPKGKPTSNATLVVQRLKDGYTVQQMKTVIVRKWRDWSSDDKMQAYLRPETLFSKSKFEQYLGECVAEG